MASPHPIAGDWNCDGAVTKQYAERITCATGTPCGEGFEAEVACGSEAPYRICETVEGPLGALLCRVARTEPRVQGCR